MKDISIVNLKKNKFKINEILLIYGAKIYSYHMSSWMVRNLKFAIK